MLDMPNALMFDEGHYSFSVQLKEPDNRVTFNFQPLPWFEGSFRYTILTLRPGVDHQDRSFDFKARLWQQNGWVPTVAVGIKDIAGTNLYGAEYIVGTYQTENFNLTAGLGFGRLSERGQITNPLTKIWDGARERDNSFETGTINLGQYFRGEHMGVFGGIEYMTPINGLKAMVEYSSDTYHNEQLRNLKFSDFPLNFGLSYKPNPGLEIGASLIQGDTFSIRFTFQANARTARRPKRKNTAKFLFKSRDDDFKELLAVKNLTPVARIFEPGPTDDDQTRVRTRGQRDFLSPDNVWNPWERTAKQPAAQNQPQSEPEVDEATLQELQPAGQPDLMSEEEKSQSATFLQEAANYQSIGVLGVGFDAEKMTVRYFTSKYSREPEAMGRLLNILSQVAPDNIEQFDLVSVANQLDAVQATFYRSELERIHKTNGTTAELFAHADLSGVSPPLDHGSFYPKSGFSPSIGYGITPNAQFSIFDPDDPLRYQLALDLHGDVDLTSSIHLAATYSFNLYNNFDEIRRDPSSALPHVRTETANYLKDGANGVEFLTATHSWNPVKDVFTRTYGGLFESMYGGVGAEILYRPYSSRWAVAFEIDWVRQRDFDLMFTFRDYETTTGFAKLYYQTPYHDLDLEINVGRYLAEDIGATFKLMKVFDNGMEIGIFATFTDVSFEDFGEGSFDKGLTFKIPFHLYSSSDTKRRYSTIIRMLTRDGGAQVYSGQPLYDRTRWQAKRWMVRHWNSLLE